ncbi:hypothetical protein [Arthrobacter sp. NEB 688]|uniref:hypothetical protein n=1 Tax=Arthrobacter sp. NEB 688 TaxID=904039 RepID=UPI001562EBC3|nr:hypothetical protein [Arthrobacter sp. NEB 688]QKE85101.1 hypothetical protein HL663_14935 [Arthrobacter sp. NEB 688]
MDSKDLRFEFSDLSFDEVNGPTEAEIAIGIEADIVILDGSTEILREPRFEVLLLAKELNRWLVTRTGSEFTADLGMVRENLGMVRITETAAGWVVSSDLSGLRSEARDFKQVEAAVRDFVASVAQQVAAVGYDPQLSTTP